ncbi:hypothetical protein C8034_v007966 [Colletotrichum sidae]|uniref:Something about silencing protein 4 domain-containing protein n=1 Tax=Colletotrichum sidae TaxID=1347389 RepID=A0A4R8T4U1_9PEZI|nr:hypothetical protein C8034_v007966 [Colletotrichum sidae]
MAIQSSPMASVTRSTRRANTESLHASTHPHPIQQAFAAAAANANANTNTVKRAAPQNISGYHQSLAGRTKRQLDAPDIVDFDVQKSKRPRTNFEILLKAAPSSVKSAVANATVTQNPQPTTTPQPTPLTKPQPTPEPTPTPTGTHTPTTNLAQQRVATVHPLSWTNSPPSTDDAPQLTSHQEKVKNGIQHELDRLQPREADTHTKEGGRKLRSQEASRYKSDLSAYFPEYDEVIGNDPKEQRRLAPKHGYGFHAFAPRPTLTDSRAPDLFNIDTPIVILDSNPTRPHSVAWHQYLGGGVSDASNNAIVRQSTGFQVPVRGYGDALFDDLVDAQRIDFDFLGISHKRELADDPLPDASFLPTHRRAERLERSIRNTERGRAQHEKDQIARLLDGLQGHDWLRIMGVSGITESRKKKFEPARQHFIKGCQAILERFRQWSLEEKRRKAARDRALAEKAEEEQTTDDDSSSAPDSSEEDDDDDGDISDGGPPGTSDDESSMAKQRRQEARLRAKTLNKGSKRIRLTPQPRPPPKPEPPREFKSFFKKRYERDAALNRHRRAGRKVVAWGHPIPEIPEVDFDLPEEFRDEETLKTQARKRRRDRRGRH